MIRDGETHYHFVYVSDLIQGILLPARTPQGLGEAFIIGSAKSFSLNEFSEMIAGLTGGKYSCFKVPYHFVYLATISCESLFRLFNAESPLHRRRLAFVAKSRFITITKAKCILHYETKLA